MESVNFKKLCRVCLRESDFVTPMFGTVFKSDIPDKLAYCTGLKITSGDGKPSLICQCCIDNLHICYTFKKTCLRSDRQFFRHFYGIKHEVRVEVERINKDVKWKDIKFEVRMKQEVNEVETVGIGSNHDGDFDNYENYVNQDYNDIHDNNDNDNNDNENENDEYKSMVDINVDTNAVLEGPCDYDDDFYWQDDEQLSVANNNEIKRKKYKQRVDKDGNPKKTKKLLHDEMMARKRGRVLLDHQKVSRRHMIPAYRYCECCDRVFPSQAERNQHARDVHGGITNSGSKVICEICGKMYCRDSLAAHLRTHFPPQFCCKEPGCGYKAGSKCGLVKHKRVHGGTSQWVCKQCPQMYKSSWALRTHVLRDHEHVFRFACSFCGKRMFSKQNVQIHERIHTDEKPYACDNCPSKFARRDQWRMHSEKMHGLIPPPAKKGVKRNRIVEIDQLKDAGKFVALVKTNESVHESDGNLDKTYGSADKSDGNLNKSNDEVYKINDRNES